VKKLLGILFITIFPFNLFAEKFIPLELWLGIEQKNINKIEYLDVDNEFSNGSKKIVGPIFWKNPINKNIIKVYERIHQKQDKKQLFAITNKAQTIGRVYDSRYDAVISGGAKFPLGLWKNNEKREFESIYYYSNGKIKKYIKSIKIESFNYKYSGKKDCLKFRWVKKKIDSKKIVDSNIYIYCPNKGLVEIIE